MKTFEVIIDGDLIRWASDRPKLDKPTPATIAIADEVQLADGRVLADGIEKILEKYGGLTTFGDGATWERDQRDDRPMPGREL